MNQFEARTLAQEHLDAEPFPDSDYVWVLTEPIDCGTHWYFDYTFEHIGKLPENEWKQFGGPPGFKIEKELGRVEVSSWSEIPTRTQGT